MSNKVMVTLEVTITLFYLQNRQQKEETRILELDVIHSCIRGLFVDGVLWSGDFVVGVS